MWWIPFAIIAALVGGGLITKVLREPAVRKEVGELIYVLLDAWDDGKLSPDEVARIISESKDIYVAIREIEKRNIAPK